MTRPTDDKVRKAFAPIRGTATVSTAVAAAALRCSAPTARRWAAAINILPRYRTGKKGPRSDRVAPHRRRTLVKRLESIGGRLLKIQEELDGTPDGVSDNPEMTAGDWITDARVNNVSEAVTALGSDPPQ